MECQPIDLIETVTQAYGIWPSCHVEGVANVHDRNPTSFVSPEFGWIVGQVPLNYLDHDVIDQKLVVNTIRSCKADDFIDLQENIRWIHWDICLKCEQEIMRNSRDAELSERIEDWSTFRIEIGVSRRAAKAPHLAASSAAIPRAHLS
jgi:hypothetical protein